MCIDVSAFSTIVQILARARVRHFVNDKCMHSALSVCNALIINVLSSVDNPLNNLHTRVHSSALVCALVCTPHTA